MFIDTFIFELRKYFREREIEKRDIYKLFIKIICVILYIIMYSDNNYLYYWVKNM